MVALTAAVVLVGVLVLLDLVLTLGLIRRLRSHADVLAELRSPAATPPLPRIGAAVGSVTGTTSDGEEVSRDTFPEGAVVGFFSTWCAACKEQLPAFLRYAGPLGRERVLSVVQGDDGLPDLVETLSSVGRVVVEPDGGPIASAFDVQTYPTLARVDADWKVTASALSVDELVHH